jgi:phage FluMu gp28-like protein
MGVLLPYQRAWNADTSPVKVWEKSRRIGASYADAADSALVAAKSAKAGGMSTYYLAYNKDMTRQYVQDAAFWAGVYGIAASAMEEIVLKDGDKDVSIFQIRFDSGFVVQALSSNPNNLRSKQGRVRIDEAAFVPDLKALLKAAMALIMWGGDVAIMSTHNGEDNDFNQLVQDIRAGKLNYSLHRTTLDDALGQGLYRRICEVKQAKAATEAHRSALAWSPEAEAAWRDKMIADYGDDADEELFCIPSKSGGAYLTRNVIEACMDPAIPVIRWTPPARDFVDWPDEQRHREMRDWLEAELRPLLAALPDKPSWFGEDFGRDVDLTDIWPLQEAPGLTWRTPFVLELRDCPFAQQEQALFYVGNRLPLLSGGALDKGGNGSFLSERARQEFGAEIIEQVHFSDSWCLENWPPAKAALEDRTVLIPKNDDILDDLRAVKKIKGVPKVPRDARTTDRKDAGKRHGDSAVAFALALFAARKFPPGVGEWDVCTGGGSQTAGLMRGY